MERSERIAAYLNDVCAQVRWKQAHPVIARELCDHIEDERQSLLLQGLPEEAAEKQAIREMGDALEVGRQFDEAYRPQRSWSVWIPFAVLMVFGVLARAYVREPVIAVDRTLVLLLFFLGAYCIPVGRLAKSTILFWGLYTIGLLAVTTLTANGFLIMGYNRNAGYMLLFLPSLSALLIYYMRGRGIFGVLLICAAHTVIALIALQNSIGSYVLVALACMCLLIYAIARGWFDCKKTVAILLVVLPVVLLFASMIAVQPSRFAQMLALFLPEFAPDPQGAGFLGATVREILGAARVIGPMDATAVRSTVVDYISRSTAFENDCMLTLLAARLGKIVFAAAVLLLAAFVFLSLRACRKQRSMLGKLISLSVLLTFAVQAAGYIAGNLGITLLLRYPMPFVAFGNQAMLCNLILCGLLFSTFRTGNLLDDGRLQKRTRWKLKLVREAE